MGFRFFRRVNILPGVQLNLGKSGGSVSVGPQGAKLTFGASGGRVTFGLPGTGLFYTTQFSLRKLGELFGRSSETEATQESPESPAPVDTPAATKIAAPTKKRKTAAPEREQSTPELFNKYSIPEDQQEFAAGCRALASGDEDGAFAHLQRSTHLADGAFLAGVLALKRGLLRDAAQYLTAAVKQEESLGRHLSQYGVAATLSLAVTEEVFAHVGPDIRGVLLALAETHQARGEQSEAIRCLERLRQLEPEDVVIKLSLAELLMEEDGQSRETCQGVLQLMEGIENDSPLHAALLLYKGKALRELGLLDAAQQILSGALKRKKDRSADLLRALRYERALVYEGQGERKKARVELEMLYAEAPEYEDVKTRLGL